MIDIISREVSSTDLKDVVNKLIPDSIARDIEKACQGKNLGRVGVATEMMTYIDTVRRIPDPFDLHVRLMLIKGGIECVRINRTAKFKFSFSGIYPLHDVHIRKVKVMKRPRFDLNKLMDMHGEGSGKLC